MAWLPASATGPFKQFRFHPGAQWQPQPDEERNRAGQIGALQAVHQQAHRGQGQDQYPIQIDEKAALSGVHVDLRCGGLALPSHGLCQCKKSNKYSGM